MGGFSSNYEGGYLDFEESPKWMNQENKLNTKEKVKIYKEKSSAENRYLTILLTDIKLLNADEQACRDELCQYCDSDIDVRIQQNQQEIEVYYEALYIGNIQQIFQEEGIDNTKIMHHFCFENNKLKEIQAFWDGQTFYLKEKKS